MVLETELARFYQNNGFGENPGSRPLTVQVYTGCLLVPLPNIETRHVYLKYHDLHHLATGYSTGRIGEGEVSAWELGTGSFFINPVLGCMNFIALSTGLFLKPARMLDAFRLGCVSASLYSRQHRNDVEAGRWENLAALREDLIGTVRAPRLSALRVLEFCVYSLAAISIHAAIAIPAVVIRYVTDVTLGKGVLESLRPVKRDDIY